MMPATPRSSSIPQAAATSPNARCRVRSGMICRSRASSSASISAAVPTYRSETIFGRPPTRAISRKYQYVLPLIFFGYRLAINLGHTPEQPRGQAPNQRATSRNASASASHWASDNHDHRKLRLGAQPAQSVGLAQEMDWRLVMGEIRWSAGNLGERLADPAALAVFDPAGRVDPQRTLEALSAGPSSERIGGGRERRIRAAPSHLLRERVGEALDLLRQRPPDRLSELEQLEAIRRATEVLYKQELMAGAHLRSEPATSGATQLRRDEQLSRRLDELDSAIAGERRAWREQTAWGARHADALALGRLAAEELGQRESEALLALEEDPPRYADPQARGWQGRPRRHHRPRSGPCMVAALATRQHRPALRDPLRRDRRRRPGRPREPGAVPRRPCPRTDRGAKGAHRLRRLAPVRDPDPVARPDRGPGPCGRPRRRPLRGGATIPPSPDPPAVHLGRGTRHRHPTGTGTRGTSRASYALADRAGSAGTHCATRRTRTSLRPAGTRP